jgi:NAD(P)-dependent dehydrogenase (short-subunit alcohol dehydrogenase family)
MGHLRLENKIAIVTGSGTGIGYATALLFAHEGASVVANVLQADEAKALEQEAQGLAGRLIAVQGDVSRDSDVQGVVAEAVREFGGLDILFNNAGIEMAGAVAETSDETWQQLIDTNLKSVFLCCRRAVPEMLKRRNGSIVNNASINAIRGNHQLVAYSASKGGIVAMTRAMALDYASFCIRVNCICPATIQNTKMLDTILTRTEDRTKHMDYVLAKHPMGRLGNPQEVAYAVLFLASDEASFITGVALPIDGGRSIR